MSKETDDHDDIKIRMDHHMKGLYAMITDAISFFTDIERQRDDVAPAGMHIPMSIHVRDGRNGLIVKHFTMINDTDATVVCRLMDRKIPQEFMGIDHTRNTAFGGDLIAFSHSGKPLKMLMNRIDAFLDEMNTAPSEHIHMYSGFSPETHSLIHSVIIEDKNAVVSAWNALPSAVRERIIHDFDNPHAFLKREMFNVF